MDLFRLRSQGAGAGSFSNYPTCQSSAVTISEETENLLELLAFSMVPWYPHPTRISITKYV
jgi:hypothetical protein